MKKEIVSSKQMINIIIMYILGSSLVMSGDMTAKQDTWIVCLLGMCVAIPLYIVYGKISQWNAGKSIFDVLYNCFGKVGGALITIIFSLYSLILGSMVTRNYSEFIQTVSLPETPQLPITICIAIMCIWTVKAGIEILGRGTLLILPIVFFFFILTLLLNAKNLNISYIQPVLTQDFSNIAKGIFGFICFPFGEVVLFLGVVPICTSSKINPTKVFIISLIISGITIAFGIVRNILVLGIPSMLQLYFPSYESVSIIDIGEFLSRIEVLISGIFLVCGIVKSSICLFVSCKGLSKLFNVKSYKIFATPLGLLMSASSIIVFKNTSEMLNSFETSHFIDPIFQIIIPLIIFTCMLIKRIKNKKKTIQKT